MARLKGSGPAKPILLLHHMDVVPGGREPLGARSVRRRDRRRADLGTRRDGHEGTGRRASLRVHHAEAAERRARPRHHPDGGARRGGGWRARRAWMRDNHYQEFEPEYILDEGGFGSRDLFAPGKLVFGISVAEKKMIWLKLTAEGVAGHGSQPHDKNPNDRLVRALAGSSSEPMPTSQFSVLDTLKSRVGDARRQQVQQRDPAFDDLDHDAAGRRRRAAENQRHPVNRGGQPRLPGAAGHVEGAVAEGDCAAARRSGDQDRGALRIAGSGRHDDRLDVLSRAREGGEEAAIPTRSSRRRSCPTLPIRTAFGRAA